MALANRRLVKNRSVGREIIWVEYMALANRRLVKNRSVGREII
jgi:hypothetical protein